MNAELRAALRALAQSTGQGPKTARVEAVVDAETDAVLVALAAEIGERNARSAAIRTLLRKGAEAMLVKGRRTA